jgi:transposase InsO family protein
MGNNTTTFATGKGAIILSNGSHALRLTNVLYVPDIRYNLLSVSRLDSSHYNVLFSQGKAIVLDQKGGELAVARLVNGLYQIYQSQGILNLAITKSRALPARLKALPLDLWHQRLGHLHHPAVKQLSTLAEGIRITQESKQSFCRPCLEGKQHRIYNRQPSVRAKQRLELIHSDSCGPFSMPSISNSKYMILYIDDCTRMTWAYFLKTKSSMEVTKVFREFRASVETATGLRIQRFRSDNGKGEYDNKEFKGILSSAGISFEPSAPYTQNQNGVSERKIRTVIEKARCMLHDAGLGARFWAEAASTAVYLLNRSPTKALENQTPYEAWYGPRPSLHHLRKFGCNAYIHVPPEKRGKLQAKARCCIMLGYVLNTTKLWRVWDPIQRSIVHAANVIFDEENTSGAKTLLEQAMEGPDTLLETAEEGHSLDIEPDENTAMDLTVMESSGYGYTTPVHSAVTPVHSATTSVHSAATPVHSDGVDANVQSTRREPVDSNVTAPLQESAGMLRRSTRRHLPPKWHSMFIAQVQNGSEEPTSYWEAVEGAENTQWQKAIDEEYASLQRNSTWSLERLPPNRKAIASRWVFKKKINADNSIRYKARLVIKGYEQREGIDYDETFAPVAMFKTIRILLAIAAQEDWEIHQMDVKSAFLHPKIEEEVYMAQPEGFQQGDLVCRLHKALYGLKQAPRAWYQEINAFLQGIGLRNSSADPNLYMDANNLLLLFVDDVLIFAKGVKPLSKLKHQLSERYDMTDLGSVQQFLGMQIYRDRASRTIQICQTTYSRKILSKFGMDKCNGITTPMEQLPLQNNDSAASPDTQHYYQSVSGSLMHAMLGTRPDLAYTVSTLSKFNSNPSDSHLIASKRALRYLQHTSNFGITYGGAGKHRSVTAFSDADWGNDKDTRRSVYGYVFLINGGAVSWKSKRQTVVALSSTEAEYMGYSEAAKEAIWLHRILAEIDQRTPIHQEEEQGKWGYPPARIYVDNQGGIDLASNPKYHDRTKHIDIRYHFIRDATQKGLVQLVHLPSSENTADILTKPLSKEKFEGHRAGMGLGEVARSYQS